MFLPSGHPGIQTPSPKNLQDQPDHWPTHSNVKYLIIDSFKIIKWLVLICKISITLIVAMTENKFQGIPYPNSGFVIQGHWPSPLFVSSTSPASSLFWALVATVQEAIAISDPRVNFKLCNVKLIIATTSTLRYFNLDWNLNYMCI